MSIILSRCPHRLSLLGSASDLKPFVDEMGGLIISGGINKYTFITARKLPEYFSYKSILIHSEIERVKSHDEIHHRVFKAVLNHLNIDYGVEFSTLIDVPSKSGLGSSSSFVVALLNACHYLQSNTVSKDYLAKEAIYIEQDVLCDNVGSQDQIAASYSGLNLIELYSSKNFAVHPLKLSIDEIRFLEDRLLIFYTGLSRSSSEISGSYQKTRELHKKNINLAETCFNAIENKNFDKIGELLHKNWELKKSLSPKVTNKFIDDVYNEGLSAGALGGKLMGSGGGGAIMFYVPQEYKNKVVSKLSDLIHIPFNFEFSGAQILHVDKSL